MNRAARVGRWDVAEAPPLLVAPRQSLRSGRNIRRMVCTLCKVKVVAVGVSGSQTTVACPRCYLRWRIDGAGQVVRG